MKSNIYRPGAEMRQVRMSDAWNSLPYSKKVKAVTLLSVWLVVCTASWLYSQSWLALSNSILGIGLFLQYLAYSKYAVATNSLLQAINVVDGNLFIDGKPLGSHVKKVVLGKDGTNLAYLQLAWNNGDQWQFDIKEYDAVAEYFAQHRPDITLVKE